MFQTKLKNIETNKTEDSHDLATEYFRSKNISKMHQPRNSNCNDKILFLKFSSHYRDYHRFSLKYGARDRVPDFRIFVRNNSYASYTIWFISNCSEILARGSVHFRKCQIRKMPVGWSASWGMCQLSTINKTKRHSPKNNFETIMCKTYVINFSRVW